MHGCLDLQAILSGGCKFPHVCDYMPPPTLVSDTLASSRAESWTGNGMPGRGSGTI